MLTNLKLIALSIFAAVALSVVQILAAHTISPDILWQVLLMHLLVLKLLGHSSFMGYDSNGLPMYEGTPLDLLAACVGLLFGAIFYVAIFYFILNKKCIRIK